MSDQHNNGVTWVEIAVAFVVGCLIVLFCF